MPEIPQSSGERHIDIIMQDLDPSSERYQILDTAKKFKSSWVELGDKLLKVNRKALYRDWGYSTFDDYCAKEIHIKKPTAQKLTLAYRFLEKQEPDLLARKSDLKPLPDYRSIDLLRQAKEEKAFSDQEYADLRKTVVEEERSHPTVLKQFKEVATAKGGEEAKNPALHVKLSLAAARRLDSLLNNVPQLPNQYREQLGQLISHLEEEVESQNIREVAI